MTYKRMGSSTKRLRRIEDVSERMVRRRILPEPTTDELMEWEYDREEELLQIKAEYQDCN